MLFLLRLSHNVSNIEELTKENIIWMLHAEKCFYSKKVEHGKCGNSDCLRFQKIQNRVINCLWKKNCFNNLCKKYWVCFEHWKFCKDEYCVLCKDMRFAINIRFAPEWRYFPRTKDKDPKNKDRRVEMIKLM